MDAYGGERRAPNTGVGNVFCLMALSNLGYASTLASNLVDEFRGSDCGM